MLDVGIGFGKSRAGNYELLRKAAWFEQNFDLPFCWGVSRKSLLKSEPDTLEKRIAGSLALAVKLSEQRVSLLRVHDVAATVAALTASEAVDAKDA
jgi:dihydropteroate synthase